MPTTPFVLVAAWAFARSSPRLHAALHANPRLGPALRDWEQYGAISRRAKAMAVAAMAGSWALMLVFSRNLWMPAVAGAILLASGTYVVSRPAPPKR